MKEQIAGLFTIIVILAVIVATVWLSSSRPDQVSRNQPAVNQADIIKTGRPQRHDFLLTCHWFGKVKSQKGVKIITPKQGVIVSVNAPDETPVKKGSCLFTLGGPQIDSTLAILQKKAEFLKARLSLAEENAASRYKALIEKLGRKEELNASRDAVARLRSELEAVKQEHQALQHAIYIRSPIDGVFTRRSVNPGQMVAKGTQLAEVIDPKQIRIVAYLFPPPGCRLQGRSATIHTLNGNSGSGIVIREVLQRTLEGATVVWIEGNNLDRYLRPGETVAGEIVLSIHKRTLAVPKSAVVCDDREREFIFVKEPHGYTKRPVKTGILSEGLIEIVSGIKEWDEVVVQGAYELFYQNFNEVYKVKD